MTLFVQAGSKFKNYFTLEAGHRETPPDLSIVTYPIFKTALLTLLDIWPAPWANVHVTRSEDPEEPLGAPPFPGLGYQLGYQMPWMFYLCAEHAARVTVPDSIPTERTPDGGLLMIAAHTRFDPDNREHMARSRILAEIRIECGAERY